MLGGWFKGNEQELIRLWTETDNSASTIAKKYGTTRNAVIGWMNRNAPARGAFVKYSKEFCSRLADEHLAGATMYSLAQRFGVPQGSIQHVIQRGEAL